MRCVTYLEALTAGHIFLGDELIGETRLAGGVLKRMNDRQFAPQRRRMGMVFQLFYLWPHLTVRDMAPMACEHIEGGRAPSEAALNATLLAGVPSPRRCGTFRPTRE
jgi:ABC-type histidine transport system ATPase subunit